MIDPKLLTKENGQGDKMNRDAGWYWVKYQKDGRWTPHYIDDVAYYGRAMYKIGPRISEPEEVNE